MFESDLRNKLITISGIDNKVYPLQAPEGTIAPYIAYTSSDIDEIQTHSGFTGTGWVSCEIDIVALTYSQLKELSKSVRNKLKEFDNLIIDTPQPELYENEVGWYRKIINIKAFIKEE